MRSSCIWALAKVCTVSASFAVALEAEAGMTIHSQRWDHFGPMRKNVCTVWVLYSLNVLSRNENKTSTYRADEAALMPVMTEGTHVIVKNW